MAQLSVCGWRQTNAQVSTKNELAGKRVRERSYDTRMSREALKSIHRPLIAYQVLRALKYIHSAGVGGDGGRVGAL